MAKLLQFLRPRRSDVVIEVSIAQTTRPPTPPTDDPQEQQDQRTDLRRRISGHLPATSPVRSVFIGGANNDFTLVFEDQERRVIFSSEGYANQIVDDVSAWVRKKYSKGRS